MEFLKLTGSQARLVDPLSNWPLDSFVILAIEDEKVIGRIAILVLPHIENLEIDDAYKNSSLAYKLFKEAENVLKDFNRSCALSFISNDTPEIGEYAKRIGYDKLPTTVWLKSLEE